MSADDSAERVIGSAYSGCRRLGGWQAVPGIVERLVPDELWELFPGVGGFLEHRCTGPMTARPTCAASQCAYGSLI
ncbi:hypothetical protein [Streptomyces sp. NPDC014656]|uniref:hypothetical protein n=1 Tax=Streptomyces sp. NPDC014656 TaxID=3364878 RepID=UPI003701CE51